MQLSIKSNDSNMSAYVKSCDGSATKWIFFFIVDEELLKKM